MAQQDATTSNVEQQSLSLKPSTWLLITIVILCLGFGLWGWSVLASELCLSTTDVIYRSLSALWLSDTFQTSSAWGSDWRIEASRWLGVVAFVMGATKALLTLLSDRWRSYKARRETGHVVVIGATDLARALVAWALRDGRVVHWSEAPLDATRENHPDLFVVLTPFDDQSVTELAVSQARMCAVAISSDTDAMAIARRIKTDDRKSIFVSVRSPWLALHVDTLDGMNDLSLFSESQIAVRAVQRRHPPFLLAQHQKHEKLHCAIVGFGDVGEAVLIETLLSSITTFYQRPVFTIIDPQTERIRRHLELRYPELSKSADLRFVSGSIEGSDSPLSEETMAKIAHPDPVSTFYVCLGNADESLATALVLKALAKREHLTSGPIHVRMTKNDALPQPSAGAAGLGIGELVPFGITSHILDQLEPADKNRDKLAQVFHEAYRETAPESNLANVPWKVLSEDYRDSNRRLVVHIPAKLASAGVDIENWLQGSANGLPQTFPLLEIESNDELEVLAALEHERWMADRRLNGWQLGEVRNKDTRRHEDLVPFSRLGKLSKKFDRLMVLKLKEILSGQ